MGKKKGSKKKSGKKGKTPGAAAIKNAGPSALELSLRLELEQLERDLQIAKNEAAVAREHNDALMIELRKTEDENGEYESYMAKKTLREQMRVLELDKKNQMQVDKIEAERARKQQDFDRMEKNLREAIVEREGELERTQRQVSDLAAIQEKRNEQQAEIASLEAQIDKMNYEHFAKLQQLKSQYLKDKVDFQQSAYVKVERLQKKAQTEAITCLTHHSHQVKADNRYLKKTLLSLINDNKALKMQEEKLTTTNAELRRQIELNARLGSRAQSSPSKGRSHR